MKKLLALLLAGLMVFSMVGCMSSNDLDELDAALDVVNEELDAVIAEEAAPAEEAPAADTAAASEDMTIDVAPAGDGELDMGVLEGLTIGFAQCENNSTWRVAETTSFEDAAAKYGVNLVATDANTDFAKQASDIRDMIAQGVDYIVCPPQQEDGLQAPMKEAMDAGIPVILVDRTITGEIGTHYVTEIMSDFVWEAEQCAIVVEEALGGVGNYVTLQGTQGASSAIDRQNGFVDYMEANCPDMVLVADQVADFNMDTAYDVMSNILSAQGDDIDAVFCHNDDMAQGAINAIKAAGYVPGEDILVAGIDGPKIAIASVLSGEQLVSVSCSPLFGEAAFKICAMIESGMDVDAFYQNEDVVYTIDTAKEGDGY